MSAVLAGLLFLAAADAVALNENYETDYFSNVTLPCNYTQHGFTYPGLIIPIKRYWVLPNGTVIPDTFSGDARFLLHKPSLFDFSLIVGGVDDPDFGVYHCVLLWNNFDYAVDVLKVGLNVDGPYYKQRLDEFETNVIIGGSVAGALFLAVLIGLIVCARRNSKMKRGHDKKGGMEQNARLHSIYEYGDGAGLESKERSGDEQYAKVDTPVTLITSRQTEETGQQTMHF